MQTGRKSSLVVNQSAVIYQFLEMGPSAGRVKKQTVVAQSSVEAKYIALASSAREALWLGKFRNLCNLPSETFESAIGEDN